MIINSQGQIFYGMHFYPGVAEYEDPNDGPFRIFINEDTIRAMGPSFAARPIFVDHVEGVDDNLSELRTVADGWVVESFFNAADGKNWAKFIVVSDRGLEAIKRGYKLSNCYKPKSFGQGGVWNGVSYQREVTDGEFEHLAIVQNPRYEESVIMTPEQFKAYNERKTVELTRLSNSKGEPKMKFFKRTKVENSVDLEGTMVELPKSKKQLSISELVDAYDKIENMNGYANGDHMVKVGEKDEMSVNDLVKKHMELSNEFEKLKAPKDEEVANDDEDKSIAEGDKDVGDRGGDKHIGNAEDEEEKEKKKKENEAKDEDKDKKGMKNSMSLEEAKRIVAKEKALRLKNANLRVENEEESFIDLPEDQVARGKARYGSK